MFSRSRLLSNAALLLLPLTAGLLTIGCPGLFPDPNEPNEPNEPNKGNSGLTGKYVGSERCATCHSNIHFNWSQTLHARALETLENIGQDKNANCVGCHVVGLGQPGGFVDRATTDALAGVGCESCHGPGRDHVENVNDESLRPPKSIAAEICGQCHTGSHHPNYEDWASSKHSRVTEAPAEDFFEGTQLNNCGKCHSGDFFYRATLSGETLANNALEGIPPEELHAVECAICHNPHARTGNAPTPEDGRDFQLRYPEVANPTPTNDVRAVTDPTRFNLCGQCHHDRGRTWLDSARPPHHSNQANFYIGEMPIPEDLPLLVQSRVSVHSFATEQCATCHMYRQDFQSAQAPAISGHTFQVNESSCATSGCHPSLGQALAVKATLQTEVQNRLNDIASRLGDPATWEYTSNGGPNAADQRNLPDWLKQVRFLYSYVLVAGSLGIHNPAYARDCLIAAQDLLTANGR